MTITTIVLADDHPVVRQGLRTLLEAEPGFSLVGEATTGLEALELVERLRPDVLILDLMMPDLSGLEVMRQLRQHWPRTCIVVFSMYSTEAYVLEALRNGAAGYVLKDSLTTDLVRAVREAVAGRRYLSPPLSDRAIEIYAQKAQTPALDPYETLTNREREVLHMAAESRGNTEIAALLSISPRTVETHRSKIMQKLGLRTQTDLIRYALRRGIIPLDD